MKLLALCQSMLEARSMPEFERQLTRAATELSCTNFGGYLLVPPDELQTAQILRFNNVSAEHHARYHDPQANRADPVLAHVKSSSLPLIWTQDTYTACGRGDLWDEQAAWGARSGISMGTKLVGGRHFALGFETPERWSPKEATAELSLADFSLVTVYAQVAAENLFGRGPQHTQILSARELEVLKWTAAGKTAWETGVILSISESTVSKHIDAAVKRLQCANKTHAVVVAMRAGLL